MGKLKFVLDVDGVMNTGQFLYSSEGKVFKIFGPHDRDGLKLIADKMDITFITADKNGLAITKKRIVDDMGFKLDVVPEEKRDAYFSKNFDMANLIYMGDGYHDAKILKQCRFGIAPASARREAREAADFVTESKAGEGAVLDACLKILEVFFPERK
ncbi:MAG: HAD hydrolase family protein [Candidatus Omnitrophota bacterium]